jgi:hypothetical protein
MLEWQYVDDPPPPIEYEPYIHFSFGLFFPHIPAGVGHAEHFDFNVLQRPDKDSEGISVVKRGFIVCVPYSESDVKAFVEEAVADAFANSSHDDALDKLNEQFIQTRNFADLFKEDLLNADELLDVIEKAFDGVEREDGVTLHEAVVIDNYGSQEEFEKAGSYDTETRWQDVSENDLAENPQFMTFLDAKGFRYYLPAAMSWSIRHGVDSLSDSIFYYFAVLPTVAPRDNGRGLGEAFDIDGFIAEHSFTPDQVRAIYKFLCFMAIEADHGMNEDEYAAVLKWKNAA